MTRPCYNSNGTWCIKRNNLLNHNFDVTDIGSDISIIRGDHTYLKVGVEVEKEF